MKNLQNKDTHEQKNTRLKIRLIVDVTTATCDILCWLRVYVCVCTYVCAVYCVCMYVGKCSGRWAIHSCFGGEQVCTFVLHFTVDQGPDFQTIL